MAGSNRSATARQFFVTATKDTGPRILKGDHVLIDVDAKPAKGHYVITGPGRLTRWRGQKLVHGVAVQINRTI